ncbi:hypothetical protein [Enhygromyxa salina]|uniref:hypothetical protein n=1 Tax=Enhygromyxa salina TaxID=215803 RepID=UPI000D0905F3|nr:hypothetical protein [Enhygromyxa salina]
MVLVALALGACERGPKPGGEAQAGERDPGLDLGGVRASAVDGLEAAARDPAVASSLGLAARLEDPAVEAAVARLLARVAKDPELARASEQLFARLEHSAATRAALVDYARQNPELDVAAISEGFVGFVDERLTRPELAARLEQGLRAELRATDVVLAPVLIAEAGGAATIAEGVVARLEDPSFEASARERLGRESQALQARLERRLADPARAGELLVGLRATLASEAAALALAEIIDLERSAELLAEALTRALADEQVRARSEQLFTLALVQPFDALAFDDALRALLAEPVVALEAAALLSALAREPAVRTRVARLSALYVDQAGFDAQLLDALD